MSKTNFKDKSLPEEQGTIITAEMMGRLNNQAPTGEDFDGSAPLLYGADIGTPNSYVVNLTFGKKAEEGANTAISTGKLIDTGATFITSGVQVGDTVLNFFDRTSAKVTTVDSETQLSLDTDIFTTTGTLYAVGPHIFQAPQALAEGQEIAFKAVNANTGASTLMVNTLTPVWIKKQGSVDLAFGDIKGGQVVKVVYDGTNFQMFSTPNIGTLKVQGYEILSAAYESKSVNVSSEDVWPKGLAFNSDGTKMYVVGQASKAVYQYTLSTGWDVGTALYASKSINVSSEAANPMGLAFNSDGTKMYVVGSSSQTVYQYTLSTGWDVSTASYASKSVNVLSEDGGPMGLAFNSDGTKMYVVGGGTSTIYQYTLSTGWDVSTASYAGKSVNVSSQNTLPRDIAFHNDGTRMFVIGTAIPETVYQYTLSSAWDVSTASYASKSLDIRAQDGMPEGLAFSSDGTKMYMSGSTYKAVYQYISNYVYVE